MLERTDDSIPAGDRALGERGGSSGGEDPAEIRAEIAETRERMGDNLEQLGERLNPGHLKEQVKQDIRNATIGKVENMAHSAANQMGEARQSIDEARRTIADTVRDNPIPAAMVGVGLGWLLYNARQQSSPSRSRFGRSDTGRAAHGYYDSGRASTAREMGSVGRGGYYGEGTGEPGTIDRVRDEAGAMSSNAQGTAGELAERAEYLAENVADETHRQARRVEDRFYENPLAIGAAALALGMAAGMAIPETQKESELMGSARDRLAHKAREVAEDTKDKVGNVVERVADQAQSTARTAAKDEGLTAS